MRFAKRTLGVLVVSLALVVGPVAGLAAAKGPNRTASSLNLVVLDSADGLPHYGGRVTFEVSTTATDRPFVRVNCYQGETWVYWAHTGYFADYPWPWTQTFTLRSDHWTGGAADCVAELYYTPDNGRRFRTLASLAFHVYA